MERTVGVAYLNNSVMSDLPDLMPRLSMFGQQCQRLGGIASVSPAAVKRVSSSDEQSITPIS